MGGVSDESSLAVERPIKAFEHGVKSVSEVLDFVVWPYESDAFVQAAVGDASGGRGNLLQRMQRSACDEPPESAGDDTDPTERHERGDEHGVEGVVPVLFKLRAQRVLCLMSGLLRGRFGSGGFRQVLGNANPRGHLTVQRFSQNEV